MKIVRIIPVTLLLFLMACKKDNPGITGSSAINVINAVVNGVAVKVNPGGGGSFFFGKTFDQVNVGAGKIYTANQGLKEIAVVAAADSNKVFFKGNLSLHEQINTLYLIGQSPNVDTMFREERAIPFINKNVVTLDSSIYVRFVNLSPNSTPVNIKLSGTNEVTGLAYKGVSEFKVYPAKAANASYVFEVRDGANTLIASYTLIAASNRFKTLSLVLRGLVGTASVFPVTYFN